MNSVLESECVKKYKIFFYHANESCNSSYVFPTVLILKTYIDTQYQDLVNMLEWSTPLQEETDDESLIKIILDQKIDILCTSHYIWNHNKLMQQLERIHSRLPKHLKIIAGGPNIDVHLDKNFFSKYPWIHYAIYGPGEQAFVDIVSHIVSNKPLIAFNTSNCAWVDQRTKKTVTAGYKFVKLIKLSPYLTNESLLSKMIAQSKENGKVPQLSYELTRGCPYSCTFCDWNSGLGNKVSRRKNTYQQEIDLFQRLGINSIFITDANLGQYEEDVELIKYFAEKNLNEHANFSLGFNLSKNNKKNNLKIMHLTTQANLTASFIIAIQDIHEEILANCDRPDVGWETHKVMAKELSECYPKLAIIPQLICGLPGQTTMTWRSTLREISKEQMLPQLFFNMPLASSPAMYDKSYQEKFGFEYISSNRLTFDYSEPDKIFTKSYLCLMPKSSSSFTQEDLIYMNLLGGIYFALIKLSILIKPFKWESVPIELIVDNFLQSLPFTSLYNNLQKNWFEDNNFFYTENFSKQPTLIPDENLGNALLRDNNFWFWVTDFFPDRQKKIIQNPKVLEKLKTTANNAFFL